MNVTDVMRGYEDATLLPLMRDIGVDPVRDDIDMTTSPGTVLFLMNSAQAFEYVDGRYRWYSLSVMHQDRRGNTGSVFTFRGEVETPLAPRLYSAEIHDVVRLERQTDKVVWRDPLTEQVFLEYPLEQADTVLMNAWHLFRGAVLPLIYAGQYRFPSYEERRAFQVNVLHHITALYKE